MEEAVVVERSELKGKLCVMQVGADGARIIFRKTFHPWWDLYLSERGLNK
jgi:hypothetical protein